MRLIAPAVMAMLLAMGCAGPQQREQNSAPDGIVCYHNPCGEDRPMGKTGLSVCDDGRVHRPGAVQCPSTIVDDAGTEVDPNAGDPDDGCKRNADCTEKPLGYCAAEGQLPIRTCHYGCVTDTDCGAGALCMCDTPVGRCVPAECLSDRECGGMFLCTRYYAADDRDWGAFACDSMQDQCNTDEDCTGKGGADHICVRAEGARRCIEGTRGVY